MSLRITKSAVLVSSAKTSEPRPKSAFARSARKKQTFPSSQSVVSPRLTFDSFCLVSPSSARLRHVILPTPDVRRSSSSRYEPKEPVLPVRMTWQLLL